MSFTVLRVEVQQWEDEGVSLPVGGQSEEGEEPDDVVEEEGHQKDYGNRGITTKVQFDHQVDIGVNVGSREYNVEYHDSQDSDHLHLYQ